MDAYQAMQGEHRNAIVACKLKDEAMREFLAALDGWTLDDLSEPKREAVEKALTIQPDDSALKEWLGEPVARMLKYVGKDAYVLSQEPIARSYHELPDGMYSDTWKKTCELYAKRKGWK